MFNWNIKESPILSLLGMGGGAGSNLIFHTGNAGLTNGSERMRINSSGQILMNTTDAHNAGAEMLHVTTSGGSSAGYGINIKEGSTSGGTMIRFNVAGAIVGQITTSGSATTYATSSDARLKDITGKARGLEVINKLNPVAYNWKESGKADEGLIAQEVMDIVPNAVIGSEEEMYQMDYSKLVTPLVKAIQEQQEQIDALQSEINTLKGE